jgi:hypothetical protein
MNGPIAGNPNLQLTRQALGLTSVNDRLSRLDLQMLSTSPFQGGHAFAERN